VRKKEEMEDIGSCLNMALPGELLFVLLARDESAPATIEFWAKDRIVRGKNKATDLQIVQAFRIATQMRVEHATVRTAMQDLVRAAR
jgi:hypothetical protein